MDKLFSNWTWYRPAQLFNRNNPKVTLAGLCILLLIIGILITLAIHTPTMIIPAFIVGATAGYVAITLAKGHMTV